MTKTMRPRYVLLSCLALLAACASTEKVEPVVVQQVIQNPGRPVVRVDASNDGASVLLERGQELRVDLPSDAYAVNNNLEWRIDGLQPGVLESLGGRFERGARDSNPSEAGGTTIWRLRPQAPGRVGLAFELRRQRRLDPPVSTLRYDVTVK